MTYFHTLLATSSRFNLSSSYRRPLIGRRRAPGLVASSGAGDGGDKPVGAISKQYRLICQSEGTVRLVSEPERLNWCRNELNVLGSSGTKLAQKLFIKQAYPLADGEH